MNGHDELISLLGAYALDAVDDDERRAVEEHLDLCADCRAEVAQHLEVAAALGTTAAASAPDELWATIQTHIDDGPSEAPARPVLPRLTLPSAAPDAAPAAPVISLDARRRRPPTPYLVSLVAAAAVIVVLLAGVISLNRTNADLESAQQPSASMEDLADAALRDPSSRVIDLTSENGEESAQAVVTSSGDGFLVSSTLDPLPADRTYQLWNIGSAGAVSLGVLGSDPGTAAFHVQGPVTTLAITAEQAGGVPSPQNIPLVTSTA